MAVNYTKSLPRDQGNAPMQEYPAPVLALARNTGENATASSVVSLTDRTTAIEIAAGAQTAFMRWVPSTDTQASVVATVLGANYDHVIPANTYRRFVVPIERIGTSSISGANVANGLYSRVAYKTAGIGSVLATEY